MLISFGRKACVDRRMQVYASVWRDGIGGAVKRCVGHYDRQLIPGSSRVSGYTYYPLHDEVSYSASTLKKLEERIADHLRKPSTTWWMS